MATDVVGMAKTVVEMTVARAQAAMEEEKKLRQSVQGEGLVFITDEIQMMQSFLAATSEERARNDVVRSWVRQVRDLAYDVEDCIEFVLHLDKRARSPLTSWLPSWWTRMLPSLIAPTLPLDEADAEIKRLRARVEDVSHRNTRYSLVTTKSKPAATTTTVVTVQPPPPFDIVQEAKDTARRWHGTVDLAELVTNKEDTNLQVITLWGTGSQYQLGMETAVLSSLFNDEQVLKSFEFKDWVNLSRPFDIDDLLRELIRDSILTFSSGGQEVQLSTTTTHVQLVTDFARRMERKRYLLVIDGVSTVHEFCAIQDCLPNMANGSRVVVCTGKLEIATLCTSQPWGVSELTHLSPDQSICVFYSKAGRPDIGYSDKDIKAQEQVLMSSQFDIFKACQATKHMTIHKMKLALDASTGLVGREEESKSLDKLFLSNEPSPVKVISLWGIAGAGKSALARDIYYKKIREPGHARCGWVDVPHPFDLRELCRSLLHDLYSESYYTKSTGNFGVLTSDFVLPLEVLSDLHLLESTMPGIDPNEEGTKAKTKRHIMKKVMAEAADKRKHEIAEGIMARKVIALKSAEATLGFIDPIDECRRLLFELPCIFVIDGVRSTEEWDLIKAAFLTAPGAPATAPRDASYSCCSCIVVVTTEESIATHCAVQDEGVLNVFKESSHSTNSLLSGDMKEQVRLLVDKCGGLPQVIVAIGASLAATKEESAAKEWIQELNGNFMPVLEKNPKFGSLQGLFTWMHSYFLTCPDYLKPCIFYLSIFPGEGKCIRRRRLVGRWIAEGYSRDKNGHAAEESGEEFFSDLVDLSIIQQPEETATATHVPQHRTHKMVTFQVNSFFREYIRSRPMEDNLVFELEGRCSIGAARSRKGRHLAARASWDRDDKVYDAVDFSRLRSLTVFGAWRRFLVSDRMKLLRVLDLEDTTGLQDDDLDKALPLVPRLKFLSLRGCKDISRLPNSIGDLTQLETLDARYTSVAKLPSAITQLPKLQYLRAGSVRLDCTAPRSSTTPTKSSVLSKLSSCWQPAAEDQRPRLPRVGVEPPRGGIANWMTKTLHTLGVIDVGGADGKARRHGLAFLTELNKLTQLRKLGVSGINRANSKLLWSSISGHGHLRSLSVQFQDDDADTCDEQQSSHFFSDISPPHKLQSLKLYGLVTNELPPWIDQLPNLTKLHPNQQAWSPMK
uniref:NB-ARC domain-containing protein n=1 Tax=Leersia perrieri TaxID=77586 RepID=A0A0D9XU25_9ORYZ